MSLCFIKVITSLNTILFDEKMMEQKSHKTSVCDRFDLTLTITNNLLLTDISRNQRRNYFDKIIKIKKIGGTPLWLFPADISI